MISRMTTNAFTSTIKELSQLDRIPSFPYSQAIVVRTTLSIHRQRCYFGSMALAAQQGNNNDNNSNINNNRKSDDEEEFSQDVRLREEAESPFRKVRYFLYVTTAGGAMTSLIISLARIAAALSGVNTNLMEESLTNAAIDLGGLILVGLLYQRDVQAEQSRLKRATKGAGLAKLVVRASKRLVDPTLPITDDSTFTTTLASLRRGRGIEKRVIIAAGGKDKINQVLSEAKAIADDLEVNDLVVVPVVMPSGTAPSILSEDKSLPTTLPSSIALPVTVGSSSWKQVVDEEAVEAVRQGVDIETEGFTVVLKKNGRVGQRTKGIYLKNLVGNVVARREAGMDVANI